MESTFHIFTDGSVIGNPGPGGWAAVLMSGDKSWEMSGSSPWTTISEMELLAAVEALRSIPAGSSVQLCSDSELLISGMLFHIRHWQSQRMAQQPRRSVAAPVSMERIACDERAVEHSVAMDQRPQPASVPDPCRRSRLPGRAHPRVRPANGRITLLAGMALRPCCQPVNL